MVLLFALRICVIAGRRSEITDIGPLSADKAEQGEQMGRPLGALKGRTKQADEFALWLREVTKGATVRTLEEHFPYGKSSWSEFRDGSRLPRQQLVEQVTARYVREPAMRAHQLARGTGLLAAAHRAAKNLDRDGMNTMPLPGPRAASSDPVSEAYLRLDDARLMQIEAMKQLAASERRRENLENMVSVLEERCTLLEGERDRAREDAQAELQHELQMSTEYRRQADEKLEHARRAEKRAYELRLAAEKQVTKERIALRRMDQETRDLPPVTEPRSVAQDLDLPPLEQIHRILETVQEQLDTQDVELNDLDEQIDLGSRQPVGEEALRTIPGHIIEHPASVGGEDVREQGQDNPRKLLTSDDVKRTADDPRDSGTSEQMPYAPAQSAELMKGLETATTPAALSTALSRLRQRTGQSAISDLTKAAFPGRLKDDLVLMTVMRWIDGEVLPDTWLHLKNLVRAMGATDHEVEAFHRAYTRTVDARLPALSSQDLSDLEAVSPSGRGRLARQRDWIMAAVGPGLIILLLTAYTAGLRAASPPSTPKLIGYAAVVLLVCIAVLRSAAKRVRTEERYESNGVSRMRLITTLAAFPAGLAIPWAFDTTGQWAAVLVGLL
ncbi:hypothetical protein OG402_39985 [Streptomyces anulatus]|uniref:hypothetical protein n=1 Tax=Streptomyces anulatus TaxID=1892 RepID=UPI00225AD3EA|nr:hypothetical protein [Streptomyces anulatus]MCX4523879.1 hypothetical protein [Streptomyces anulatus]MCX4606611.1 hypothetical protein [Streptomyces anulatus]WSU79061.1 hypothetical protein OG499_39550 [Streptomyces anulatus]WTD15248.1 hypothetical protein OHA54_38920 [Streptomyces anulatus]WTD23048.1 hypothetical protein OH737_00125 [Streptomyces anulatus]